MSGIPTRGEVQDALFNLTTLTECKCPPDYTQRGRHHPTECVSEFREDVDVLRSALEVDFP